MAPASHAFSRASWLVAAGSVVYPLPGIALGQWRAGAAVDDDKVASILITGMSGAGKSSAVEALASLGHQAVDLDSPRWSHLVPDDSAYASGHAALDWRWREPEVRSLLADHQGTLFVAGTSTYQARLYDLLDHVILLSVPAEVAISRLASRTSNVYGKDPAELARELKLREVVEPLLRQSACLEVDTGSHPVEAVAAMIADHARQAC
jgi:shikimate kinase